MKNKVLVKIVVPDTGNTFDIFVPVNEVIWKIKKMAVSGMSDLTSGLVDNKEEYCFMNIDSGKIYNNNEIIIDTDIRNASELALLKINK